MTAAVPAGTFLCPDCTEVYQEHWRDPRGTNLCGPCASRRAGVCDAADQHPGHLSEHPCSYGTEAPGSPCRYCDDLIPADGTPCPRCWISFEGAALADIKAVLSEDGTFSVGGLGSSP